LDRRPRRKRKSSPDCDPRQWQGIDAKHLDKIFDPFFTTKEVGEGMGLGLSICYRIVQEYGGKISVKTEPGKFCEFTLEFPVEKSGDFIES
jgi:two-component system NtrC family sensor kinase